MNLIVSLMYKKFCSYESIKINFLFFSTIPFDILNNCFSDNDHLVELIKVNSINDMIVI